MASGMRVMSATEHEVFLEKVSQLRTRLLGTLITHPRNFPQRASVTFRETPGGLAVDASIYETFGFAALFDSVTKKRYESHFVMWLRTLRDALRADAGNVRSATTE